MLQIGFGRVCITPDFPVCLAGGGYPKRIFTQVLEDIYVTCIAITDNRNETALLLTQDLVSTADVYANPTRSKLSDATGVPVDHIFLASTHTHSAPTPYPGVGNEEFMQLYYPSVVRAAQAAMADRSEATVRIGQSHAEGLVFVRRYKLADGTYEGASGNTSTCKELVDHAYASDDTVQIIRFLRPGKKDILLTNLGAHATFKGATGMTNLSPDFPGAIRDYVESNADCLVAYFIAAAGDQTPTTRLKTDDHGLNYRRYGQRIGELIVKALPHLQEAKTGNVAVRHDSCTVATNRQNLHRLADALAVWEVFQAEGFKVGNKLAHEQGFASVYEAMAIKNHANLPETMDIGINAMGLGDVGFIFASYEMYSGNAAWVREHSPYPMTFVITCCNGSNGYLPSEIGYEINCYEAYNSNVGRGAGEKLADLFIKMLTRLKNSLNI